MDTKRGRPKARLSTLDELAYSLAIHRSTAYKLIDAGMPYVRVGAGYQGGMRFDLVKVREWLESREDKRQHEA